MTFASDDDFSFVIGRKDKTLKTSRFAAMYDNVDHDVVESDSSGSGEEEEFDDQNDEDEQISELPEHKPTKKTAAAQKAEPKKMYGALPFKPVLQEYMIDTGEESMQDMLFYVRQSRRLAHLSGLSKADLALAESD